MRSKQKLILDHIFGDLDLPENSAPWLIQRFTGVYHGYRKQPLNPKPEDVVTLTATTSDEQPLAEMRLWYTTDDWQTYQSLPLNKTELTWNSLRWGRQQAWQAQLSPQPEDTLLHYKLAARVEGTRRWVFADSQADSLAGADNFSIWYAHNQTPAWAQEAVVYQVFVDRFNSGQGQAWLQTTDLEKPMGGTLAGVTEKLDTLHGMGFNAIWLTPIFASPSHHGYDTSDYLRINPRLGSLADFDDLVARAHHLGMHVILDFVVNHCSDRHPAFVDAQRDPASPYHDWFFWQPWPEYKSFYNVHSMPELDLRHGKPARQYLLGAAQDWLKRGVDGFRLDYAHGPAQDFWVEFQRACRQVNPHCWTFGEIVQPADRQASFAGGIDGSLDFLLCQALRLTFAQQTWSPTRLAGFLQSHYAYYPPGFSLPAFIDNHDMNRFLFAAHGSLQLEIMALQLLYFLPGAPIVYYGTEAGLSQHQSIHEGGALGFDEARLPMPWEGEGRFPLSSFLQQLAELRAAWYLGSPLPLTVLHTDDQTQTLVLQRGVLLLALNLAPETRTTELVWEGLSLKDICTEEVTAVEAGQIHLALEPLSARFFVINEPC